MEWHMSWTTLLAALVPLAAVAVDALVRRARRQRDERKGHPLPPGPASIPLLGSALLINARLPWLTYTEWRAKYGDIMYVRLLDTDVIVLSSVTAATDLLEKRSRIYSDRPFIPNLDSFGCDCNFGLKNYGEHWRLCRRIFQQTFNADAALAFQPMQLRRARQFVSNMIDDPSEYSFHFQTFSGSVAMSAVYEYEPSPRNDPMIYIIDNYLQRSIPGLLPGNTLILKLFPFLLYVPEWLPGSWISRQAKEARAWRDKMIETPYRYTQERMKSREQENTGMVSTHIARMEDFTGSYRSRYETALKDASVTAFIGAAETTTSTLLTFLLAMVENPRVWKRAQAEIDAVIGTDRLPEFDDRLSLPYIEAIIRETIRWRPATPMLIPHAVTCSDIYEGYYIPKGASIFVNAWGISRDEARYSDAEKFMPERFLDKEGRLTEDDPREFIFGFGRRKCPGRHVADASLWSAIATMLATLDFNLAKDADGKDITFKATFASEVTDHPNPFPCRIAPRAHVNKETFDQIQLAK